MYINTILTYNLLAFDFVHYCLFCNCSLAFVLLANCSRCLLSVSKFLPTFGVFTWFCSEPSQPQGVRFRWPRSCIWKLPDWFYVHLPSFVPAHFKINRCNLSRKIFTLFFPKSRIADSALFAPSQLFFLINLVYLHTHKCVNNKIFLLFYFYPSVTLVSLFKLSNSFNLI